MMLSIENKPDLIVETKSDIGLLSRLLNQGAPINNPDRGGPRPGKTKRKPIIRNKGRRQNESDRTTLW